MSKSDQTVKAFRELVRKIKHYEEAAGLIYWDMRTGAPKKGMEARSEVVGMLSTEMFKLTVSDQMGELLGELADSSQLERLSELNRKLVKDCKKEYDRSKQIPADRYEQYVVLTTQAESVWEEAKDNDDFKSFQPYLEKIVAFNQEFIDLWGVKGHRYNTLLDMYEPDMTVDELDQVFKKLRDDSVELLQAIQASPHQPDTSFLEQSFDEGLQEKFGTFILKQMGYDFEAGRLDRSAHPFATGLNPGDVRITTKYKANDFTFSLYSTIHEGGHALYEQNLAKELLGTTLCTGTSMGIHESQSRFWENMIARSEPFWKRYYRDLLMTFPGTFDHVNVTDFYRASNVVQPSLIRIEADELTYNLHIMIRYELEKALFGGDLQTADLPGAWNEKYKQYLGIEPRTNQEGVLQDVHWSGGSFGYFPSYSLGNMYAAQFDRALRKQLPDLDQMIAEGELKPIKDWLALNIHRHGKLYTPSELVQNVTGESLNPVYLTDYLNKKFKGIYQL